MRIALVIAVTPVVYLVTDSGGDAEPIRGAETVSQFDFETRFVDNTAFGVGELLTFDVNYGFINAGTATLSVTNLIDWRGRPAYLLESRAQSNDFFSSFFRVDDRIESVMDAEGMFSWRFEKSLREGGYSSDREYEFNQRDFSVDYKDSTYLLEPFTQDILSAFYFVRTQDLEPGRSVFVDAFLDGRKATIEVLVHRRERITVKAGAFDCLVVEPVNATGGMFRNEGKLTIWLTDDRLKMPVLMKSRVLVGSISAELTDYQLGELVDL